jgi:leader peptidase (prepilin peptidase) / N-methyltransferase
VAALDEVAQAPVPAGARSASQARDVGFAFLSAAVLVGSFAKFGFGAEALVSAVFGVVLVVLAAIDLERRIIPNRIVLPATAVVLPAQIALHSSDALAYVLAAVGAALFFLLPLLVFPAGMGMGDVKLALLLGAGLGGAVLTALFVGVFAGAFVALAILVRGRGAHGRTIAFGPYLALGGLVALFFG